MLDPVVERPMKKPLLFALWILSSGWFYPVSLAGGTSIGMAGICVMQNCSRNMLAGDAPHKEFHVMVSDASESNDVTPVLLQDLPDYLASNKNASLRLHGSHGTSKGSDWEYSIISENSTGQMIAVKFVDDIAIAETYRATERSVQPLSSKVQNVGYLFTSLPFGLLLAWAIRKAAVRRLRASSSGHLSER